MNRNVNVPAMVGWVTLCVLSCGSACAQDSAIQLKEAPAGESKTSFAFKYSAVVNTIPDGSRRVEVWLPVPTDNAHQKITEVELIGPHKAQLATEPKSGNTFAYWKVEDRNIQPFRVTLRFVCERREVAAKHLDQARELSEAERKALASFLKADRLVPVGNSLKKLVEQAKHDTGDLPTTARGAYDYVLANVKYDKPAGKAWGRGSTAWACTEGYGNCTDFHALFMSLVRSRGLPAKFEIGFQLPTGKKSGPIGGYHCWAKFYLGGIGWVPVDASEAWKNKKLTEYYFGHLTANRVTFTTGRDVNLVPKQSGKPLNFFIYPYAEADGKPFKVGKSFEFKYLF